MSDGRGPSARARSSAADRPIGRLEPADVELAVAGDRAAIIKLVDALTPVIQARVARVLFRVRQSFQNRSVRQEVEDLTQEAFLVLFADQARVLRSWDGERGLSLLNFVGLVAERRALSLLRTGKHNPWTEDPTVCRELDRVSPQPGPEGIVVSRDLLGVLLRRLEETLSPLGKNLFDLLYIQELSVNEVVSRTGMGSDAVYAWRSRLRRLARRLLNEGGRS